MPVPPVTCKQQINARGKEDSNVKESLDLICPFDCEFDDGCGLILEWIRGEGARIRGGELQQRWRWNQGGRSGQSGGFRERGGRADAPLHVSPKVHARHSLAAQNFICNSAIQ